MSDSSPWLFVPGRDKDIGYIETFDMESLYDSDCEVKAPAITGLLHPGLYLFAGAPKIGKSFCMLQMAYCVSMGLPLWGYETRKSTVLYCSLEDTRERLQKRLYRMYGMEMSPSLFFATESRCIGEGFIEQLCYFSEKHPDIGLIIIDTLQKVRKLEKDEYSYAGDYEIMSKLKEFADAWNISIILVHHTRKQESVDRTEMISGTNGLLGAVDGAFVMYKLKRTDQEATIDVTGRDTQDQKIYLERDPVRLNFTLSRLEHEKWEEPGDPLVNKVIDYLKATGSGFTGNATQLVEATGLQVKPNVLTYKLNAKAEWMYTKHHIIYVNQRTHQGREIQFSFDERNKDVPAPPASGEEPGDSDRDTKDDIKDKPCVTM